MTGHILAIAAATCSALVGVLHIYIIVKGPQAYRAFGAGETLAGMAERGSWLPGLLTAGITAVFFLFAAYYAAAAGLLAALPQMRVAVIGIAAIYTLRGALVLLGWLLRQPMSAFDVQSSLASLAIGLLHCAAAWLWLAAPVSGDTAL
ncbi:hypothetical protein [Cupriavidus campinensis]